MQPEEPRGRLVCARCRRPSAVCYCAHLVSLSTRTRVVFLQHPREAKVPIGTARMSHLMLVNSELHQGVRFAAHPRVQELAADPTAALLFPGEGAQEPAQVAGAVQTLVVIDGTWAQARKVLRENPILQRLPRIGLLPERPGNYRIRREPTAECLATVEAVANALGALEQAPGRFDSMLGAFTFMVDRQLERAAASSGPRVCTRRRGVRAQAAALLRDQLERAVLVHCEVNAHARDQRPDGRPELLQLCALRLATGERFHALVAPRRPLAANAPYHLRIEEEELRAGEPIAAALARWAAFLRPEDVLGGWGHFTRDQLLVEGAPQGLEPWLDLRRLVSQRTQDSAGTPELAAQRLGQEVGAPVAAGRTGRLVAALGQIARALLR